MDLRTGTVLMEYYKGLRLNGWPKDEAAKAARRHVKRMTPKQIKQEVERILNQ
jgi:hypothetical protein